MDRKEFSEGLKVFRIVVEGLERIVQDPEAIARMQRRALEKPALLLGPTLVDYIGLDSPAWEGIGIPEED